MNKLTTTLDNLPHIEHTLGEIDSLLMTYVEPIQLTDNEIRLNQPSLLFTADIGKRRQSIRLSLMRSLTPVAVLPKLTEIVEEMVVSSY